MTPNDLRVRLIRVLSLRTPTESWDCPACHGTGQTKVSAKVVTQTEVAATLGVSRSHVSNFLLGKSDVSLPIGLHLAEWLDEMEAKHGVG